MKYLRPLRFTLACATLILAGAAATPTAAQTPAAAPTAPRVRVKATGQAPASLPNARETAVEDALRRCVEAGGGVQLAAATQSEDFALVSDVIYTKTAGYVQTYEVLQENPDQEGLYTVRVSAVITTGDLNTDLEAFKALLKRKGHPRILLVGSASGRPLGGLLTARLQGQLERKGLRIIDQAVFNERQRQDAQRAARLDGDPQKAALIAEQLGADILAIVQVTQDTLPEQTTYGQTAHRIDAVGVVKLIRADTAEVLGSIVEEQQITAATAKQARRKADDAVTKPAMNQAVRRIASHWLNEVDQRGGQEILIVMHRFSFRRTSALVQKLRQVEGVSAVVIDRTDAQATGQIRVTTHASASDVAGVLVRLDQQLEVTGSSANRVDVR